MKKLILQAIDMYWDLTRLSLQICVMKKDEFDSMHDIERQQSMPCLLQESTDALATQISAQSPIEMSPSLLEPPVQSSTEIAWVNDDVEYVGLDDEDPFKTLLSDGFDFESASLEDDIECVNLEDDLVVEDEWGCDTITHATELENPTIQVGIVGAKLEPTHENA